MTKVLCLLVFVVSLSGNFFFSNPPKLITVAYHEDFPPYVFEENGYPQGIFPEMMNEAAKHMGVRVIYVKFPWKRMLQCARDGEVDAIMPLLKSEERETFLIYPNGIALAEVVFFTRSDSRIQYTGALDELKPYTIGVVADYFYGEAFNSAGFQIDESLKDEMLVDKLLRGRFEVGAGSDLVIKYYTKKHSVEARIKFLEPSLLRRVLYTGFPRSRPYASEFAAKFSEAVKELQRKGIHQKILDKYGCGEDMVFVKELIIGCDQMDHAPYTYWKNGQLKGVIAETAKNAADQIGVNIRFIPIPWNDFPELIRDGKINGVIPNFKTRDKIESLNDVRGCLAFPKTNIYKKLSKSLSDVIDGFKSSDKYKALLRQLPKITLIADSMPPYYGRDLTNYGPISEIITEAFNRVGFNVNINFMPRMELLEKIKKGQFIGSLRTEPSFRREKEYKGYYASTPVLQSAPLVFIMRKDAKIIYNNLGDLKNYRLGVIRGMEYTVSINKIGLKKIEAESAEANIFNLLNRLIDLIITDRFQAQFFLDRIPPDKKSKMQIIDYKSKRELRQIIRLIISKKNMRAKELIDAFNEGLKQISMDGTFDRILKKHGIDNEIRIK
ncbi:MAG: transporter substrate-binding domain-containing protein [Candidatus Omnitrophota bacterium]